MRAHTKGMHEMGKRWAVVIGVAAVGVIALGAQTAAQTPAPTPPGQAPVTCNGLPATIVGTEKGTEGRDPPLIGTRGRDVIVGLGGNDTLSGLGGNDVICGGDANDTLKGGSGKDTLLGQAGGDVLKGGPGRDFCNGGTGGVFHPMRLKGNDTASKCEVEKSI
jgi:RTX calcium-binding nonapeptide repeat (4 copies)